MADAIAARRSPLLGLSLVKTIGAVDIADAGACARFVYRGVPDAIGTGFGVVLPTRPLCSQTQGLRSALWLGPDEWLLMARDEDVAAVSASLRGTIAGKLCSLVDISHRQTGLILSGPKAGDVLAVGCPLDLHDSAFAIGGCARTLFAKAEVVVWRLQPDVFHVEVGRSFAPYVVALMSEAIRDLA